MLKKLVIGTCYHLATAHMLLPFLLILGIISFLGGGELDRKFHPLYFMPLFLVLAVLPDIIDRLICLI